MLLRKILISTAAVIFILYNTALCEEYSEHEDKKVSIALKFGTNSNYNAESDYKDFWEPNVNWTKFWPREASYEYKFSKNIGLEMALGYSTLEGEARNISAMPPPAGETKSDRAKIDLANIYFSPSIKLYFPIKQSFSIYGGLGPDVYDSRGDILYTRSGDASYNTKSNVSKWGYGAHGMIGAEYYFFKNPAAHNLYDWPVSIELQYKYTWAMVGEIDKKLMDDINTEIGISNSSNDINVGGHLITIGVRWHLF